MSADLLRRAAASMRERHIAIGGSVSWAHVEAEAGNRDQRRTLGGHFRVVHDGTTEVALVRGFEAEPVADFIASWHPAVALAVADWLDEEAEYVETTPQHKHDLPSTVSALAVARAYLGADA